MAGQSNAEGHTANPGFTYDFLRTTIYRKTSGHTTNTDDGTFVDLQFGVNNSLDTADNEADVGAEFAKLFEANDPASLRMVKVAVGSSGFDGGSGLWARGGVLREALINRYLRRAIPDAVTAGDTINILPVLWIQGENEATNSTWAAAYQADLTALIADVRGAAGILDLPFLIVRLHDDLEPTQHLHAAAVRSAQDAVAAADPNVYILNPSSITGFDGVHYTVAGFEALAQQYYDLAVTIGATPYTLNTDASAFVGRLSGSYSQRERHAINSFVATTDLRAIAAGGSQWDNLTTFTINAMANATDGALNLKGTSYTQMWVGSPTFTARQGVKLSGSGQYLKSGVTPAAISSSANGLYGAYLRLNQAINGKYTAVAFDGTNATFIEERDTANRNRTAINRTAGATELVGVSDGRRAISTFRSGGIAFVLREQGSAATAAMTGSTAVNAELWWGAFHTNGVLDPGFESSNQFAAEWQSIGIAWAEAEVRLLHAEIQQILSVFGAAI